MSHDTVGVPDEGGSPGRLSLGLGVALSGGGHRASLFGLGALLYLVDSALNKKVDCISSVSGGSITNAFVAQECVFNEVTPEEFDKVASRLATSIVRRGIGLHLAVRVYIAALVLTGALWAVCLLSWPAPVDWYWCLVPSVILGFIASLRGMVVEFLFGATLFTRNGQRTRFGDLGRNPKYPYVVCGHVFCATDLLSGTPFYFVGYGGGRLYWPDAPEGYSKWSEDASKLALQTAVRASAALPGAIPPKRLVFRSDNEGLRKTLFLADGGVWNNLATDWWKDSSLAFSPVDGVLVPGRLSELHALVVNATAPIARASSSNFHFPLLGELNSLKRAVDLLYANTVMPRVTELETEAGRRREDDYDKGAKDRNYAVISIDRDVSQSAVGKSWAPLSGLNPRDQERAKNMTKSANRAVAFTKAWTASTATYAEAGWADVDKLAEDNRRVPTVLTRLDERTAVSLMIHGYLLAMEATYVAYGEPEPLPPIPGPGRFMRLLSS